LTVSARVVVTVPDRDVLGDTRSLANGDGLEAIEHQPVAGVAATETKYGSLVDADTTPRMDCELPAHVQFTATAHDILRRKVPASTRTLPQEEPPFASNRGSPLHIAVDIGVDHYRQS